jgi:hypothetical protein
MNDKYSYNRLYSSNFVKFSILNAYIFVRRDFLKSYLSLQTILGASFDEKLRNKCTIEYI